MRQARELSNEEQAELLQHLFTLLQMQSNEPVPEWHKAILDERIREMDANPDDRIPADEVYAEVLRRLTTPQS